MASRQLPTALRTGRSRAASGWEPLCSRQARTAALDHALMASLAASTSLLPCMRA